MGSNEANSRKLLAAAHEIGDELLSLAFWPELVKFYQFATAAGQSSYTLPTDYYKRLSDAEWDRARRWRMDHIGPRQYEQYEASLVAPVLYQRILFSGSADNQITIQDTPTISGEIISFPYMSCQWIKPKTWVAGTVTVQGEYVWYNGRTYKNTTTASGAAYGATPPTHTTGTVSDGGVNWDYYAQPLTRFTADTDEPLFHPELIAKGIEYKFLEKTGLDFGRAEAEYVRFRDAVKPNLSGASKIRLGKRRHRMRGEGSIPEGSWAL